MKHTIAALLTTGGLLAATLSAIPLARAADVFMLTSPAIQDNGTLATKNACSDKQRSPNCVGENISPPLAWSNVPDGEDGRQELRSPEDWWTMVLGSGYLWTVDQMEPEMAERLRDANLAYIRSHNVTSVETNVIYTLARKPRSSA